MLRHSCDAYSLPNEKSWHNLSKQPVQNALKTEFESSYVLQSPSLTPCFYFLLLLALQWCWTMPVRLGSVMSQSCYLHRCLCLNLHKRSTNLMHDRPLASMLFETRFQSVNAIPFATLCELSDHALLLDAVLVCVSGGGSQSAMVGSNSLTGLVPQASGAMPMS